MVSIPKEGSGGFLASLTNLEKRLIVALDQNGCGCQLISTEEMLLFLPALLLEQALEPPRLEFG
jgi:hypothetical protein